MLDDVAAHANSQQPGPVEMAVAPDAHSRCAAAPDAHSRCAAAPDAHSRCAAAPDAHSRCAVAPDAHSRCAVAPDAPTRYRLGVGPRLVGAPLRAHDSRRWAQQPHLSVSLAYVRDILGYLESTQIRFYRLSSNLAPYATYTGLPAAARGHFAHQLEECSSELAAVGDDARAAGLRLTMHPAQFVRLDAADDGLASRSLEELTLAARLMDAMGLGEESVLVLHAAAGPGRAQLHAAHPGDALAAALARFARRAEQMPPAVRRRVVVENDDRCADIEACLWLHKRTGLPIVFDLLHHRCLNPAGMAAVDALARALATWPAQRVPKIHLSSPRTELRLLRRQGRDHIAAPLPNQHADFLNPFECIELLRAAQAQSLRAFDILLEAKAHDLALLRLRAQIAHFAPDLAACVA